MLEKHQTPELQPAPNLQSSFLAEPSLRPQSDHLDTLDRKPQRVPKGQQPSLPCLLHISASSPTHLLKLPGFVVISPLEKIEQDDVTENSPLEEEEQCKLTHLEMGRAQMASSVAWLLARTTFGRQGPEALLGEGARRSGVFQTDLTVQLFSEKAQKLCGILYGLPF